MLVNMSKLLADAQKGDYAVGSFSVANMEMVLGVLKAAKELLDLDGCKLWINGTTASVADAKALSVPVKMAPGWVNYDA